MIAVKELLRDSPPPQRRFALEAAITARLQHPGIVPLYDIGRHATGEPFYCMKLVDGADPRRTRSSEAADAGRAPGAWSST